MSQNGLPCYLRFSEAFLGTFNKMKIDDDFRQVIHNFENFLNSFKNNSNDPNFLESRDIINEASVDIQKLCDRQDRMVDNNLMKTLMCGIGSYFSFIENPITKTDFVEINRRFKRLADNLKEYVDSLDKPTSQYCALK